MLSLVRHLTLFSGKNPTCFYFRIWLVNKITPTYIQSLTCRTLKFLPPEPPNTCLSNTIAVLFVFSVSIVCNVQKHCVYITHVGLHSNVQTVWKPTVDVQLHWFVKTCFFISDWSDTCKYLGKNECTRWVCKITTVFWIHNVSKTLQTSQSKGNGIIKIFEKCHIA